MVVYNPYIFVPLATWLVAQVTKFAIAAFKGRLDFRYLYSSGGMPSVHSAVVCSLATTALLVDGYSSHLFGLTLILAAIVMYDSFGVRRSSGEQAAALNAVFAALDRGKIRIEGPALHMREILGHQPEEVSMGAVFGVVLGMLFNYNHLGALGRFLSGQPGLRENIAYFVIAGVLIVGGIVQRIVMGRRRSRALSKLSSQILVACETLGWLTLLMSVFIYEQASYLAWRLWILVLAAAAVIWISVLVSMWRNRLPVALKTERELARKGKWFNFRRKKKK
jgi:acid phosphatase family membrane protein YuiD